jgi:type 1 glutamine amidotransferase
MTSSFVAAALAIVLSTATAQQAPHVVFMIGEDEYQTWDTLPEFARKELEPRGHRVTIVHADPADKNHFPGLVDALRSADLLVLSVRRRTPRAEQLDAVRAYLGAGKPLVGIRTASHAFALRGSNRPAAAPLTTWQEFDPEVLGGNYSNHHGVGPSTVVSLAPGAAEHPIVKGVSVDQLTSTSSLYKVSPLQPGTRPLLMGTIPGQPSEPVAWTHVYGRNRAKIFYTSLGHPEDFKNAEFRRLLMNAVLWGLEQDDRPAPALRFQ